MATPIVTNEEPVNTNQENSEKAPIKGVHLDDEQINKIQEGTVLIEKKPKTEANALKPEDDNQDDNGEQSEDKSTPPEATETDDQLEEVIEIEDPGEYKAPDYSFEVTVYSEDKDGNLVKPKTIKVDSIDKWEQLLADEPNLGTSLAINKAFRAAQKMESGLDADRKDYDKRKAEYDKAVADDSQSKAQIKSWENEIAYLEDRGDLPKVPAKFKNVSWIGTNADKEALADESVKVHVELLEYMRKENIKRRKLGLGDLGPESAFNARMRDSRDEQANNAKKKAATARKEAGSRVSGSTSNPMSAAAPPGIAVGVGGSLRDLSNNAW